MSERDNRDNRERETVFAVPEFWVLYSKLDDRHELASYQRFAPGEASEFSADPRLFRLQRDWSSYLSLRQATWLDREIIEAGEAAHTPKARRPPIWSGQSWWLERQAIWRDHGVIQSVEKPGMLAYFQTLEKACVGLRTQIRPGRYLSRYFPDMPEAERARMARWQETGALETDFYDASKYPLAFATTRAEIRSVYINGPGSCMSDESWDHGDQHPCEVYAAGDLAIAHLTEAATDRISARALVWPARKIFGRVYPTAGNFSSDGFSSPDESEQMQSALKNRLLADGWQEAARGGFNGAKLLRIELDDDRVLMPYLDGGYCVNECDDGHFTMQRGGDFTADSTEGSIHVYDRRPCCERCDERYDADEGCTVFTRVRSGFGGRGEQTWCQYCYDNYTFMCEGFNETFSDDVDNVVVEGATYTQVYADDTFSMSAFSDEYFSGNAVKMASGEIWSEDEFDLHGFVCAISGDNLPLTERHADYPDLPIGRGCDADEIAEYLASIKINDPAQEELEITP